MYHLQNRWRLEGRMLCYYGLRNAPALFRNHVKLNAKQLEIVQSLPRELNECEQNCLRSLIGVQVVEREALRSTPSSLDEARFCISCIANDYIIPGLEFDNDGRCPMCQTKRQSAQLRSVVPIKNTFERAPKSRFDVALFYTGGKDSTYLLYYLSKVQKLRVLALTWEIPYMSDSAKQSIEHAKERLDSVEFITRKVSNDDLRAVYRHLYGLSENTCACPSLAYLLFYPEMVANRVPYFITGNEPVQMLGLYYNHMAPKLAYTFASNRILNVLINVSRLLTLHPPLKMGQLHTLMTMKQLAYGDHILKKWSGYTNTLVSNVVESIHAVPELTRPLKSAIRRSSWTGSIPAFVQVDLNEISGGVYDWKKVKAIIIRECGWVEPEANAKGLHTSCKIEKCKEHSQFVRFYRMESNMIPFSALELSLACRDGQISRADALCELRESLGFSLDEIEECTLMKAYFQP